MEKSNINSNIGLVLVLSILFLNACGGGGGGGGGGNDDNNNVPAESSSDWNSMVWNQDKWK